MLPKFVLDLTTKELEKVEKEIKNNVSSPNPLITRIGTYICNSGGKRIRPILLLLTSKMCGYFGDRTYFLASIVEYIHAATLLHDDVIDHSNLRRGMPSANKTWGNELPILVGDYLYAKSFYLLVGDGDPKAMEAISTATMTMTDGEIFQLQKKNDFKISVEEYLDIVAKKTAFLFSVSSKLGAILGKVTPAEEDILTKFGLFLGMAFQLIDDALDFVADQKKLGKPVGHDLKDGNLTMPIIYTLSEKKGDQKDYIIELIKNKDINNILPYIDRCKAIDYTFNFARDYINKAKDLLASFPESTYKQALLAVSDYVVERHL
ncbi:MAG: polyprenyl synthetase family protein [bacterium]